jgi:hypothetical protein
MEVPMAVKPATIQWTSNLDEAVRAAQAQRKAVLLDFSAAPM